MTCELWFKTTDGTTGFMYNDQGYSVPLLDARVNITKLEPYQYKDSAHAKKERDFFLEHQHKFHPTIIADSFSIPSGDKPWFYLDQEMAPIQSEIDVLAELLIEIARERLAEDKAKWTNIEGIDPGDIDQISLKLNEVMHNVETAISVSANRKLGRYKR